MSGHLIDDLPWIKEVSGHHAPVSFYLTSEMFGGLPIEMAGAELSAIVERPVAAEHQHPVPEVYLLLSPQPGEAEIEVHLAGETHHLTSPAAFFVPAKIPHFFVTKRATRGSFCLGLLLNQQCREPKPATQIEAGGAPVEEPPSTGSSTDA